MDMTNELDVVYRTRLLESEEDVCSFEQSLANIVRNGDVSVIPALCRCFDDGTNQEEVMFGLVHSIEALYANNEYAGLCAIAATTPLIIGNAREWVETLHYRILNDQSTRRLYSEVLSRLSDVDRDVIVNLLRDIEQDFPDLFKHSVAQVLSDVY